MNRHNVSKKSNKQLLILQLLNSKQRLLKLLPEKRMKEFNGSMKLEKLNDKWRKRRLLKQKQNVYVKNNLKQKEKLLKKLLLNEQDLSKYDVSRSIRSSRSS